MHFRYISFLTAMGLTVIFSICTLLGFFEPIDNRVYDLVLRLRPAGESSQDLLFLDIDDQAIAETGIFPWPRSVMAEGILLLKEFGAADAILDIEYIDKSPTQINEDYLKEGLRADFQQRFTEIRQNVADLATALSTGQIDRGDTALFTDVQGFTSISEKLSAESLVFLLNDYLSVLSNYVLENSGIIDKYEGDAMIAFFGAPIDLADHAVRACAAAVTIKQVEQELNKRYKEKGMSPRPLWTRIGINTGDAVVGNMGTQRRMDYTMMGHTVNMASRLEGVNKLYGTGIIASENTIAETKDIFLTRRLDRIRAVGIEEPVRIYEVIGFADRVEEEQRAKSGLFEAALLFYEGREWGKAAELFREILRFVPGDIPSGIFLNRSEVYRENPPSPEWDAVVNLTEK
jgi:class 3 adenylate cyclase